MTILTNGHIKSIKNEKNYYKNFKLAYRCKLKIINLKSNQI